MHESIGTLIYRRFDLHGNLAALVELLTDVEQADHTGEQVTEATLREQLTWSGQDPALNNWVVALPDSTSLVGYGIIQKTLNDANADLHIVVHPSWRRQGIGSQIFARLLERASELDSQALRAYVEVLDDAAWEAYRKANIPAGDALLEVLDYDIDYGESARLGEELTIETWFDPLPSAGKAFTRLQHMKREETTLVRARSRWAWKV